MPFKQSLFVQPKHEFSHKQQTQRKTYLFIMMSLMINLKKMKKKKTDNRLIAAWQRAKLGGNDN